MGLRFHKSINLGGGFRVNLSKSGIGYSWGTKGARFTKTAKGTTRSTLSIPGTGISYVSESKPNSNKVPDTSPQQMSNSPKKGGPHMKKKFWPWILVGFLALSACGMLSETDTSMDASDNSSSTSSITVDMSSDSSADTSKEIIVPPASSSGQSSVKEEQKPTDSSANKSEQKAPATPAKKPDSKPVPIPVKPEEKPKPASEKPKPAPEKPKPAPEKPKPVPDSKPSDSEALDYVLNTNTMKVHVPGCSSVDKIKPENRGDFHGSRDDVIKQGYKPCGRCHP